LEVTNEFGCVADCDFMVVVFPLPTLEIAVADEVCVFETLVATLSGPENPALPYLVAYEVNGEFGPPLMIDELPLELSFVPDVPGTFTIEILSVIDDNGCEPLELPSVEVTVLPLTEITLQPMDVSLEWGAPAMLEVAGEYVESLSVVPGWCSS
jgi:hypothetical protein